MSLALPRPFSDSYQTIRLISTDGSKRPSDTPTEFTNKMTIPIRFGAGTEVALKSLTYTLADTAATVISVACDIVAMGQAEGSSSTRALWLGTVDPAPDQVSPATLTFDTPVFVPIDGGASTPASLSVSLAPIDPDFDMEKFGQPTAVTLLFRTP